MAESKSYASFKTRIQEIFDFAILITISVPELKKNIKLYESKKINRLSDPDYFEPSVRYSITDETILRLQENSVEQKDIDSVRSVLNNEYNNKEFKDRIIELVGEDFYNKNRNILKRQSTSYINDLKTCATDYKQKLATYLYFSTFSYFEAYIIDICKEISSSFEKVDYKKYIEDNPVDSDTTKSERNKLGKKFDKGKMDRYLKYSKTLKAKGYLQPSQLMFATLIDYLNTNIEDLKANQIPDFLMKVFLFQMTENDKKTYANIRTNRNSIGHGASNFTPYLSDVINANKFFKKLSKEIDSHILFHFDTILNYLPTAV
jgi:hypothetical protein